MKDWLFYPLVIAFIGAVIVYALSLAKYEIIDLENGLSLEGRSLSALYAAQGTSYSMAGDNANPFAYAVLSAHVSRENAPKSAGVFLTLSPKDKKVLGGKRLRITINARKGRTQPLDTFDMAYFATNGDSGWKTFELTNEFMDYSFEFTSGPAGSEKNDYVGIWPDVSGQARTMDVKRVTIDIVDK